MIDVSISYEVLGLAVAILLATIAGVYKIGQGRTTHLKNDVADKERRISTLKTDLSDIRRNHFAEQKRAVEYEERAQDLEVEIANEKIRGKNLEGTIEKQRHAIERLEIQNRHLKEQPK